MKPRTEDTDVYWQFNKTLSDCCAHMFLNSIATDVTFRIKNDKSQPESDTVIGAHTFILMSRSPVFSAMIHWPLTKEQRCSEIVLHDADPEAFYRVLKFLYTDEVELEPQLVMHIWYLAKKYLLSTLERRCIDYLQTEITPDNAAIIYDQSVFFDEQVLIKKCRRILSLQTAECLEAPSFLDIHKSSLQDVVDLEVVTCDELCLFNACCRWARHHCDDVTPQALQHTLGDIISGIRFKSMKLEDFETHVYPSRMLTSSQSDEIMRELRSEREFEEPDRRYKESCRLELTDSESCDVIEVSGPVAQYDLDLSIDSNVLLHHLLLYDTEAQYHNKQPDGNECLQVKVILNGSELFSNYRNKEDSEVAPNVKKVPMYAMPLKAGAHTVSIKYTWKGRCLHCAHFAQCGLTVGAQFCYNCGNYSGLQPKPITVAKKARLELENHLVTITLHNKREAAMPCVGFVLSDPRPASL